MSGTFQGQEINQSDAYGMTLVDAIYRGLNWKLRFRGLEWNKAGILAALQAFGSTGAPSTTFTPNLGYTGVLATIGDKWSTYSQSLVLSAILGNPPTMPQTLTALSAVVAPQSNVEYMMTSKVREAPMEMVLLPYSASVGSLTENVSFTTT